jgi:hypothetical protein
MVVGSSTALIAYLLWQAALQVGEPERVTHAQLLVGVPTGRSGSVSQARHCRAGEQVTASTRLAATSTYDEIVSDARRCNAQEACAIAGGVRGCRCPVAVRARMKQAVDDAAQAATCEQVERLFCPPLRNPRCEKEACIADQVLE